MAVNLEVLEARQLALELLMRGVLTSLISNKPDPIAEVDRLSREFLLTLACLDFVGVDEVQRDAILRSLRAVMDANLSALRARIIRPAEQQAAAAAAKH